MAPSSARPSTLGSARGGIQICAFRLFANREFDDVFGAERGRSARAACRARSLSVVHHRDAIAEPRRLFHVVSGRSTVRPRALSPSTISHV